MMEKRLSLMEWDIVGLNLNFDNYIFSPPFQDNEICLGNDQGCLRSERGAVSGWRCSDSRTPE